ncbi:hypothetical protein [Listeria booriae]|uniref:Uncharacterized protein n=2 Tax=Listeria booriae TaxID=1552123 RepID=A0A7X0TQ17_9LIST|nr:hypothetical protein [Listeria booriae]MBC1233691.1 hypothetical protein [Listeria booriae]MBC1245940.1 hypothetical protein [Listeria booriae]MBC1331911.1 hypothetical protein [Listeria booriae]MBC2387688.1 hypothetical protein [Listeria booriae]
MGIFKKLLTGITSSNVMGKYGTLEDWQKASPNELKKYKENIKLGVEQKTVPKIILGSFLMVEGKGEEEEGERILREAMDEGVENAERDYSAALAYYYMQKGKFNTALKKDKWFPKWIEASEKCVEQGYKNAESSLADIYSACYGINDPEFDNKVGRIVELFEVAAAKHQSMAALNYARFIKKTLSSDEYRQKNTPNYKPLEEAKPYFLQAIKDEKGTQFESSAYEAILWYYVDFMQREVYDALDGYASERKLTNKNMNKLYEEVVTYLKHCGDKKVIIQKSVTSCVAQLELIILASELKAVPSLREVADNYVWQVSKKHFQKTTASIPKEECLAKMIAYFVEHKEELVKEHEFNQAFYDFIEKRIAKV